MGYSHRETCKNCERQNLDIDFSKEQYSKNLENHQPVANDQKPPNIFRKAANFAKASVDYAASGFENVSENVKSHRMKICNNCEFMIGPSHDPTCSRCGCYLNLKTSWASQSCPIGKWGALNQNQSGGCKSCGKKKT